MPFAFDRNLSVMLKTGTEQRAEGRVVDKQNT